MDLRGIDIARLKFIMTTNCDFACDYCYEGGKSTLITSADECIAVGVEVLNKMEQKDLTLLYFGGEPLLRMYDMMKVTSFLMPIAYRLGKTLLPTVITNGTIVTDLLLRHMKIYHYRVSVSCDGIEPAQHCHRHYHGRRDVSTFSKVMDSLDKFKSVTKDVIVSMVVTCDNVSYLTESVKYFIEEKGIRNFCIAPVVNNDKLAPPSDDYEKSIMELANYTGRLTGDLVLNPPFYKVWDESEQFRLLKRSDNSVTIEVSPIDGVRVLPESSRIMTKDFGTMEDQLVRSIPRSHYDELIAIERQGAILYRKLRGVPL